VILARALAQLCSDIYDESKKAQWLHYWEKDDVVVGHIALECGTDVIVFRGSEQSIDWVRNLELWPTWYDGLGYLHAGFSQGIEEVVADTASCLGGKVVVTGHSLGGARARIFAAMRHIRGLAIDQVTVFGSPKPGFGKLSEVIQTSGMVHTSYRHGSDPVPELPGILPFWQHPEPWSDLLSHDNSDEGLIEIGDHFMAGYIAALG
jgi:hypothetical protein